MVARRLLVISALAPALMACANEQSTCQLGSEDLVLWATVTDLNGKVEVEIEVEAFVADGEGSSLELCPNRDTLLVNGEPAESVRAFGSYYYQAEFEDPLPDAYEITFARKDHASAVINIEMPPSFEILAPTPNSSYSRADDLSIMWAPTWPDNLMQVAIVDGIGSSCIDGLGIGDLAEDTGAYVVTAGSLVGGGSGEDCEVTLSMARSLLADYPSELHEGGEVGAHVRRIFTITSTE